MVSTAANVVNQTPSVKIQDLDFLWFSEKLINFVEFDKLYC